MTELVFGLADNGILLLCALFGASLEGSLEKKLGNTILCALVGNAISDGVAGLIALDLKLAIGSFLGCMVPVIIHLVIIKIKSKKRLDKALKKVINNNHKLFGALSGKIKLDEENIWNTEDQEITKK